MKNKQFRMNKVMLSLAAGAVIGAVPGLASATEASFGGDIIVRPFYRDNARDFNSGAFDTKKFTTERARLKANMKVDEDINGVIELMHFRKWGAADPNRVVDANTGAACLSVAAPGCATLQNAVDDNWMDMNQAYIEVKHLFDTQLYTKIGRQEMAYGDQRLVGNTNFWSTYPFPRAYDAVKLGGKYETFDIDAWYATVTERQFGTLFGPSGGIPANAASNMPSDRAFSGIWATLKNIPNNTIDLYLLNMDDGAYNAAGALATYEGVTGLPPNFGHFPYQVNATGAIASKTQVHNFGARLKGKNGGLDYTVELNQQTGKFGGDSANINASGGAAVVGYAVPDAMGLRISGEYVFASGDDTPNSGNHKTFYQFTPSPHMHLGAQDFIAFQNVNAWRIGASFNAMKNLKLSLDYWDFKLDKVQDYWYGSNGITTRNLGAALGGTPASGSAFFALGNGAEGRLADKNIGNEIDLVGKYDYSSALSLELGYSVFNPGSGIKNAPALTAASTAASVGLAGHTLAGTSNATFAWGMLMLKF